MITWLMVYFVIGAVLATISGIHMQVNTDKGTAYKVKAILGLVFLWPFMILYVLVIAGFFMISGGIF